MNFVGFSIEIRELVYTRFWISKIVYDLFGNIVLIYLVSDLEG